MVMLGFVMGLGFGIAITILVKDLQDIKDIKEFELMYVDKIKRIKYLERKLKEAENE